MSLPFFLLALALAVQAAYLLCLALGRTPPRWTLWPVLASGAGVLIHALDRRDPTLFLGQAAIVILCLGHWWKTR